MVNIELKKLLKKINMKLNIMKINYKIKNKKY